MTLRFWCEWCGRQTRHVCTADLWWRCRRCRARKVRPAYQATIGERGD